VRNIAELLTDPHVRARGAYEVISAEQVGRRLHLAPPWKLSRTPASTQTTPAARMGQDNAYVYGTLLGLEGDELAALEASGVIRTGSDVDPGDNSARVRPEEFPRRDADFLARLGLERD
jgi:hypothetical protein